MTPATDRDRTYYGQAVKRAALLLDKLVPGWEHKVNLRRLNMESGQLCMLGQLFGTDVEMSIAKELYPEEFEKAVEQDGGARNTNGYTRGLRWIGSWRSKAANLEEASQRAAEFAFLDKACGASKSTECLWADEVASRLAKE